MVERKDKNPRFLVGGIYTPASVIGSIEGSEKLRQRTLIGSTDVSSVLLKEGSLVPTLSRFNLEKPKFQQ
jgi:hypothetical protein